MGRQSGHLATAALLALVVFGSRAAPAAAREHVSFDARYRTGTVVVITHERRLYLVTGPGSAIRYTVGVGKAGKQWRGSASIDGKHIRPAWVPPPEIKRDKPRLPNYIAGGAANNPMGAAALTLSGGQYAIHGTTRAMRRTVGTFASYGCIRMLDEDVLDLYRQVQVGTPVVVLP